MPWQPNSMRTLAASWLKNSRCIGRALVMAVEARAPASPLSSLHPFLQYSLRCAIYVENRVLYSFRVPKGQTTLPTRECASHETLQFKASHVGPSSGDACHEALQFKVQWYADTALEAPKYAGSTRHSLRQQAGESPAFLQ